jgi:methylenetetrahydrofolate dehydrogenase (NADP+)/methenyltetrahydrofolate cyclohydrolase
LAVGIYDALLATKRDEHKIVLGIIVCGNDPVIESFVRIKSRTALKLGVEMKRIDVPVEASTEELINVVTGMVGNTDGIIVQLPLPLHIDTERVLASIPVTHDVDGINPTIPDADRIVLAPVACAVQYILLQNNIAVQGKHAVVVGAGRLVGTPTAHMLKSAGADVSMVTLENGSLDELHNADIIVLGAGNPGFVKPEMIKNGVVLIDAGTSEAGGKIAGDADPTCEQEALLFTPVPGGVGPIAVAMIFKNLYELVDKA